MVEFIEAVTWEAPEHRHIEKSNDWYWAVGIVAVAAATVAIIFNNTLFGVVIFLGACTVVLFAQREPKMLPFAVTLRGIQIGSELYPYSTLESYYVDDENPEEPQLLVKSQRSFMPLLILPIPEEYMDEIEDLIAERLPEEHLEEPFSHKLLEMLGF